MILAEVPGFFIYTTGFAVIGLFSFYLIARIIDEIKITAPWKSLVLFPFILVLILIITFLVFQTMYSFHIGVQYYFITAMIGFPAGWFLGLIIYIALKK